ALLAGGRPDELRERAPEPGTPERRRAARLRLDGPDLPASQAQGQLALLRLRRDGAGLRGRLGDDLRAGAAGREDARDLEPAAVLRHRPRGRAAPERHLALELLRGR